jgi:hypothetical protein
MEVKAGTVRASPLTVLRRGKQSPASWLVGTVQLHPQQLACSARWRTLRGSHGEATMAAATKKLTSGQKAAQTRKRRAAAAKGAATRKRKATAAKAAATRKRNKK